MPFRRSFAGRKRRRFTAFSSTRKRFRRNTGGFTRRKRRSFVPKAVVKQTGTVYRRGRTSNGRRRRVNFIRKVAATSVGKASWTYLDAIQLNNGATWPNYAAVSVRSMTSDHWADVQTKYGLQINDNMYIETIQDRIDVQNSTNMTQIIEMYELFVRKDSTTTSQFPEEIYRQGLIDQGIASASALYPSYTPFDSTLFCQTYKINRVRKIFLKVGDRRQFTFTRKTFKNFQYNWMDQNPLVVSFRNWTKYYLFMSYGTPVSAHATNPTPPPAFFTLVNNGPVCVNITHAVKIQGRINQVSQNRARIEDNRDTMGEENQLHIGEDYAFTNPKTTHVSTFPPVAPYGAAQVPTIVANH